MEYMDEEFDHYGVKGMRWGHRKQRQSTSTQKTTSNTNSKTLQKNGKRTSKRVATGVGVVGASYAIGYIGGKTVMNIVNGPAGRKLMRDVDRTFRKMNPSAESNWKMFI